MEQTKIIYFLSHPIQYFAPLLKALSKKVDLEVYYFSDASIKGNMDEGFGKRIQWDAPLLDGYSYHFLKNYSKKASIDNHLFDVFNPGVLGVLRKQKNSLIVVNGWSYSSNIMAVFFGSLLGKKIWLRAENPLNQEVSKSKIILGIKKILLKHILFRFFVSKCLYIGIESKGFFEFYGVPSSKLIYTPYSVDNEFFQSQYLQHKQHLSDVKKELGLPDGKKIILFVGKYISKKRPMDLIKVFQQLANDNYALVMVGEGQLRGEMEQYIQENNLKEVYLTGFINQSQIPKYYTVADVFVMCSGLGETWGLAVNEAMNFEKPIIVSKTCGSCPDLVRPSENGFAFEEGNMEELFTYLKKVLEDDVWRAAAGKKSLEIIHEYSIEKCTENMATALN